MRRFQKSALYFISIRRTIIYICTLLISTSICTGQSLHDILVLGIAQDAGFPQINCHKECCRNVWNNPSQKEMVASLAIINKQTKTYWVIDATPDFKEQINLVQKHLKSPGQMPEGIILTHAHIGHYTGLMDLGREAMGAKRIKVFAMPKMIQFLKNNGPWNQLIELQNITLKPLQNNSFYQLDAHLGITPFKVPHRDEFSETVGYKITSRNEEVIYIPDIDKWIKWNQSLKETVISSSLVIIDGTFYQNGEIPGRNMSEIPHPFVEETMNMLETLPQKEKNKIHFIHLNHTNPILIKGSPSYKKVIEKGFRVAFQGMIKEM